MNLRRSLTAGLAAALLLAACAGDDVPDPTTDDGAAEQSDGDDAGQLPLDDGSGQQGDDTPEEQPSAEPGDAAGIQPATVTLRFDGQVVPIANACNGADGAVLATTEGEVTISLVREESTALRYQAEGLTAETDQVEVEEVGVFTIHRATIESDDVPALDVEMELSDTSVLEDC